MGIRIQVIAFIVGIAFFIAILRYIKKKSFHPSFSILWIFIAIFLISIPLLEPLYRWFAYSVIGINDARHIIYIILILFLLLYVFFLTSRITKISDQIQNLISIAAILEKKIERKNEK